MPIRRTVEASPKRAGQKTIWLFGGSTQFGWGVPDSKTIASYLSAILSGAGATYSVVNYGHTGLYSSQEAAIFTALLRHGQRSDVAVFLDGVNDLHTAPQDFPLLTYRIEAGFLNAEDAAALASSRQIIITPSFPPVRVLNRLLGRRVSAANTEQESFGHTDYDPLSIYQFNVSSIEQLADSANIKIAFFWQPTPLDFLAGAEERRKVIAKALASPQFERAPYFNVAVRQIVKSKSFHFIADIFKDERFESMYVDSIHYGDEGSRRVALAIATGLKSAGLLN
ncbi:MAG TPA: SGNH/GDSL hydrolase family protein [Bryobacteraceae bacterium]|nr:SGNH/GDSL hydrolase family protein [Bryobacteraceae bacterium]